MVQVKIGGMGYAILRVTAEQLRELHQIPPDVIFTKTMDGTTAQWHRMPHGWYHDEHPFYFRIQHRYLPRTPDRGPLVVFTLRELLKQYDDCVKTEKENRGKPIPENLVHDCWVEDDA